MDAVRAQIRAEIADFRKKLLDLSLRNPLLSFSHWEPSQTHVRIIDELPDRVFEALLNGTSFGIRPLPSPRTQPDDEETEEFRKGLADLKARDPVYSDRLESLRRQKAPRSEFDKLERRVRDWVRLDLGMERWEPEIDLSPEELARRHGLARQETFDALPLRFREFVSFCHPAISSNTKLETYESHKSHRVNPECRLNLMRNRLPRAPVWAGREGF